MRWCAESDGLFRWKARIRADGVGGWMCTIRYYRCIAWKFLIRLAQVERLPYTEFYVQHNKDFGEYNHRCCRIYEYQSKHHSLGRTLQCTCTLIPPKRHARTLFPDLHARTQQCPNSMRSATFHAEYANQPFECPIVLNVCSLGLAPSASVSNRSIPRTYQCVSVQLANQ